MENTVTGMSGAITALSSTVSADALWGVFNTAVPYIGVIVLVAFGFRLVRKMVKGVSKGKTNM